MGPFLHLTLSKSGAPFIEEALRLLGRDEDVVFLRDDLTVGPLYGIDRGPATRDAWWRRICLEKVGPKPGELDETDIWKRIVVDNRNVVVWHAPDPGERIMALRACWFLRQTPSRLYEVPLPPCTHPDLAAFYGAVGVTGSLKLAEAWPRLRRVRNVDARADQWAELRRQRGDKFRALRRGRIIEQPITIHDRALMRGCAEGWTRSTLVLGRVIADVPAGTTVLSWRVRELLAAGMLKGRGPRTEFGLPEEIRSAGSDPSA